MDEPVGLFFDIWDNFLAAKMYSFIFLLLLNIEIEYWAFFWSP